MRNIIQILTKISLLSLLLVVDGYSSSPSDSLYYQKNPVYKYQVELFKLNKLKSAKIVMFGDSHIQSGNWNELLGINEVVNRGIAGDDTQGMIARIQSVLDLRPKVVIIEAGINDVYNWVPNEVILDNLKQIVSKLKKTGSQVILQSIFYSAKLWGEDWIKRNRPDLDVPKYNKERNKNIDKLNAQIKQLAQKEDVIFLDINQKLSNKIYLKDEYTRDQLHLNANGYKIWSESLLIEINKLKLKEVL